MADIAPPNNMGEGMEIARQPTLEQSCTAPLINDPSSFTDLRMPKLRGRLRVMTSALNGRFARESQNIDSTKSYIEHILASDARQLFLRGVMLNDSEMDDGKKTYWMDTWDNYDPSIQEPDGAGIRQAIHLSAAENPLAIRLNHTNSGKSAKAVAEPSSEIDLQHLDQYQARDEKVHSMQQSIQLPVTFSNHTQIDTKEQPHNLLIEKFQSLAAYRTGRRRLLLHTVHKERRLLSNRLDQIERELETYGAMRNMGQVWNSAPVFVSHDLDSLIHAIGVKIAATRAKPQLEQHPPEDNTKFEAISTRIEQRDTFLEGSEEGDGKNTNDHSTLARKIYRLRQDSAYTEARSKALASAMPLPSPQAVSEYQMIALSSGEDLPDSQDSSMASSLDESRRPSTATDHSFVGGMPAADGCNIPETNKAEEAPAKVYTVLQDPLGSSMECSNSAESNAKLTLREPAGSRDCHQPKSSTSTMASMQSESSAISSHLSHISHVNETTLAPINEKNTTPKARTFTDQPHPDEETRKLLRFRRELLRELHFWDHIQKCLIKRMDAIRHERARLLRYVAMVRATDLGRSRHHQASTSAISTTQSGQAGLDPDKLLSRQRERARQLGFAPGVIVVNPDTPTNAGAYVLIPPAQQDCPPSFADTMVSEHDGDGIHETR